MDLLKNDTTKRGESQAMEYENLYEFEAGRVRLDWGEKPTRFFATLDGEDLMRGLPSGAEANPYIAAQYFAQGVRDVLREKIKKWLTVNGYNAVTGCRINLPCEECRRQGRDGPARGCVYIERGRA